MFSLENDYCQVQLRTSFRFHISLSLSASVSDSYTTVPDSERGKEMVPNSGKDSREKKIETLATKTALHSHKANSLSFLTHTDTICLV